MTPTRAALAAALAVAALGAGCGGGDGADPDIPGGAEPEDARVIEEWSTALREGDVEAAADYFEVPSIAQNGTPPLELESREAVVAFNEALPCGAELIRAERRDRYTVATFELTERPGAGECGPGVGTEARTAFVIRDGKIAAWIRAAEELEEPAPSGPVI
ncbi:MAG: nuclear transport factor 2 family protein [Actinobacteria bacterium]|nr:nuclear transport factor 2 family protein [Actinomycetota bacterium]